MGCTTSNNTEQNKTILPLPLQIINSYIDSVPLMIVHKLKDKFESHLKQSSTEMSFGEFHQLFKSLNLQQSRLNKLFQYFSNHNKHLKVSLFIEKYSILTKSVPSHFSQILHYINCKIQQQRLDLQQYLFFIQQFQSFATNTITIDQDKFPLTWTQFFKILESQINWNTIQKGFRILSQDDMPWEKFRQQAKDFHLTNQFNVGQPYFVISAQWFQQWMFFYGLQDSNQLRGSNYQSTKSSSQIKSSMSQKRKASRARLNGSKILPTQSIRNIQHLQAPTQILFTSIQGQYLKQLKPYLFVQRDIQIVNQNMWLILKKFYNCKVEFRRFPIDQDNLDLYPVAVYFYYTRENGQIDSQQYQIINISRNATCSQFQKLIQTINSQNNIQNSINQQKNNINLQQNNINRQQSSKKIKIQNDSSYFYKNFGETKFHWWDKKIIIGDIAQQQNRIVIVFATNQTKFLQKYQKSQQQQKQQKLNKQKSYFNVGDKVLAYFSFQDKFIQAYILNYRKIKKQYKVHFIGFSYNYDRWIKSSDIKVIIQQDMAQLLRKKSTMELHQKQSVFKGLRNIGNTCFMNSTLQSLVSTSILDKFLLKANLSQKKYPLNHSLSKIFKGLKKNEQFDISDFKKIVNKKMSMFSGCDQHDAQEFLNMLLDKMDQELVEKPNIVDQLFGGIMQSKFTCLKCNQVKTKQEKIHSISLPIPQPDYNYFKILLLPIYSDKILRIFLRLHKNATTNDYLSQIQRISKKSRYDFNYMQSEFEILKRFRNQILFQSNEHKRIIDLGFTSTIQIRLYEKLKQQSIDNLLTKSTKQQIQPTKQLIRATKQLIQPTRQLIQNKFYDFYHSQQTSWGLAKIIQNTQKSLRIDFLKDNILIKDIQLIKQQNPPQNFHPLATKIIDKTFRKIYLRKFDQQKQKMVFMGYQFLIGLPKWASFDNLHTLVNQYLRNLVKVEDRSRSPSKISMRSSQRFIFLQQQQQQSAINQQKLKLTGFTNFSQVQIKPPFYIIHLLQTQTNSCIFCHTELKQFHSSSQITQCCIPQNKQQPIQWLTSERNFYLFIDWVVIDYYNQDFCQIIEMDKESMINIKRNQDETISLEKCLDLWKKPENIQMKCQKCSFPEHLLQTSIKKAPLITIFHLKQFKYTLQGHLVKIDVNLEWKQAIDLQKYCTTSKSNLYEMYSIVEHKGSTNSGHYTTLAKHHHPYEKKKVWVNFDDQTTNIVSVKPNSIRNAYLLFFKKVEMPMSAIVHFSI